MVLYDDGVRPRADASAVVGRLAELRFQVEVLLRGYTHVEVPLLDRAVDLMVEGISVQIKASSGHRNGRGSGRQYTFTNKRGVHADVVAFHGVAENLWWIVPGEVVERWSAGKTTFTVCLSPLLANPGGRGRPSSKGLEADGYRDAWHLFGIPTQTMYADA